MQETYKDMKNVFILVLIATFISFVSLTAMFIYSMRDVGTPINESFSMEEAAVIFHTYDDLHLVQLEFVRVTSNTVEEYEVHLKNEGGKTVEIIDIIVNYNYENTESCWLATQTDTSQIYYYDLIKK